MMNEALQFTCDVLNQYLKSRFGLDEVIVVLNSLMGNNGAVPLINQNKLVISLINIEKETAKPYYVRNQKMINGDFSEINQAERYSLNILVSSNFDDYSETLKFLNAVILFFQVNNVLDAASFSAIPTAVSKLDFEIEKLTYHQMQSLWTAMGAKYQPSVIYKMRLVTIQGGESRGFVPAISNISNQVSP
jgi:hypothetical protein